MEASWFSDCSLEGSAKGSKRKGVLQPFNSANDSLACDDSPNSNDELPPVSSFMKSSSRCNEISGEKKDILHDTEAGSNLPSTSEQYPEVTLRLFDESCGSQPTSKTIASMASTVSLPSGSSKSKASAFLLGMTQDLGGVDLPEFVKDYQTTLSFPEKLMLLLTHVERQQIKSSSRSCISWTLNGQAIVIRNKDELVKNVLPLFFPKAKFSSFTRKLYRWGFRQLLCNSHVIFLSSQKVKPNETPCKELRFSHGYFQRDNRALMTRMRSVTAAGTRRAMVQAVATKRSQGSPIVQESEVVPWQDGPSASTTGICPMNMLSHQKVREAAPQWTGPLPPTQPQIPPRTAPTIQLPKMPPYSAGQAAPSVSPMVPVAAPSADPVTVPCCPSPTTTYNPSLHSPAGHAALPDPSVISHAAVALLTTAAHVAATVHQQMLTANYNKHMALVGSCQRAPDTPERPCSPQNAQEQPQMNETAVQLDKSQHSYSK